MLDKITKLANDIADVIMPGGASILGGILKEGLISQVLPGATTIIFSYRQKRTETMILKALDEIEKRFLRIEAKLSKLSIGQREIIKEKIFPIFWDFISVEQEEEKIKIIVNGLENIIDKKFF